MILYIFSIVVITILTTYVTKAIFVVRMLQEMQRINPVVPRTAGLMKWEN